MAASCLLPALVYSLFWSGYTRTGLLCTLYGGLCCGVVGKRRLPAVADRLVVPR
ncbi:hypothetical protein [Streptomyces sp. NPDC002994]|uniref:hypothetical protein n=1 Tax=Streptomyces sp. NPDC002994 TaxID=3154441 RepID=UPI0033B5A1DA